MGTLMLLFSLVFCLYALSPVDEDTLPWTQIARAVDEHNLPPGEEPVKQASAGALDQVIESAAESRADRAKTRWTVLGSYGYFDTWVPSKVGIAAVYNDGPSQSYELQFDRGSVGFDYFKVSLGKVSDDRISLLWRRFGVRNSFNYFLGLHHSSYRIRLGSTLLSSVTGSKRGAVDMLELTTAGPSFGIGNRWQTRGGFVWSVDWLVINFPAWILKTRTAFLDETASASDRKSVEDVLSIIKGAPTGTVVKAQLGYAF
ncbi:MAG: hypothetical protein KF799_09350 [Bdellovibrionales bacterium]|nr:hypothetical protein [Bdellovibrionales bacterium]